MIAWSHKFLSTGLILVDWALKLVLHCQILITTSQKFRFCGNDVLSISIDNNISILIQTGQVFVCVDPVNDKWKKVSKNEQVSISRMLVKAINTFKFCLLFKFHLIRL